MFDHSSVWMEKLKQIFVVLEKRFVRVKQFHDICWLSRIEAIEAVSKSYNGLVLYFEEGRSDALADGIAITTIHVMLRKKARRLLILCYKRRRSAKSSISFVEAVIKNINDRFLEHHLI